MEKEIFKTVKYPASLDSKFTKISDVLGLSKRQIFIKIIDYFYQSKKDQNDLNDEVLKNIILKNHKTYISFIKAQESLLLMPMREAMDKMINNQRDIVKYFNE